MNSAIDPRPERSQQGKPPQVLLVIRGSLKRLAAQHGPPICEVEKPSTFYWAQSTNCSRSGWKLAIQRIARAAAVETDGSMVGT